MDTIVCPDAPIVVGFSLGVLTVLIVQEGDHLVQHRFSNRKARAKGRACKVESEVGTDSVFRNKILEAPSGARIRIIVKTHPFIDLFINRIAHGSRKLLLGQQLTGSDVALEKKLVTWNSNPVDVAKPAPNAHANAVLRVVDLSRCCVAPS